MIIMGHFSLKCSIFVYFWLKICIYAIFVVPLHDFCYTANKAAMKTQGK